MHRIKCAVCGEMFVGRKGTKVHRRCVTAYVKQTRGSDFYQLQNMRAQVALKEGRRRAALKRWRERFPDCPPATAVAIYMAGYRSGHRKGRREWAA